MSDAATAGAAGVAGVAAGNEVVDSRRSSLVRRRAPGW
jgi:hypothetical protein